jgi:hypothetical protein
MIDFTIRVEDDATKYAMELFLDNAKDGIAQFVNNVLRNEHGACDASIQKGADGTYEVYKVAPDKGWVLSKNINYDGGPLELIEYSRVKAGDRYVLFDGDKLALYLKEPVGSPDLKIGMFPNLNIAVAQFDSKEVEHALEQAIARRDNARKEDEKLEAAERRSKLAASEEPKQLSEAVTTETIEE